MQGEIGAESIVGQGTSFWVELPLSDGSERCLVDGGSASMDAPLLADSRVVLYVEDNLSNFKLIERVLAHRPHVSLLPAMQGGLGLELARKHQPDLILLDVHLPDIDGDEVLRRLQGDPLTQKIPVIMISADATPRQMERILGAGAAAYLTKPLQVGQFLKLLDETLEGAVAAL
jgi:CheY-like chemotaxis protein